MPSLTRGDFFESGTTTEKSATQGDYAGQTRKQIVESKIKDKKPFIIGETESAPKVYGISLDKTKFPYILTYTKKLGNDAEGTYPVTKIFKDKDFGGGAGSGGGADDTKYTESCQCYFTSLAFNVIKGSLKKSDCTPENIAMAAEFVDARHKGKTISYSDIVDKGPESWVNEDTYRRTANIIYDAYNKKFVDRPVYCHRGSKFMDAIYDAKKSVMKTDTFSAPGSFSNDKWNPGDIWLSTLGVEEKPLAGTKTWAEINQKVLKLAGELDKKHYEGQKKTSLLGVSLKKLQPDKGGIDKYNTAKRKHNVIVKYKNFTFGKTGKFFNSADIYFNFDVANVQLRSFNTTSSWQGEIKGLAAAGGKIGGGNLNYYLEKHALDDKGKGISIGYPDDKGKYSKIDRWKETTSDKVDLLKMYNLYVSLSDPKNIVAIDEFTKQTKLKGNGFKFSKNMCVMFMSAFLSQKIDVRNKIATEVVRYAASNTDISSFFIKVSWIQFTLSWTFFFQITHLTLDNTPLLVYNGTHEESERNIL